MNSQRSFLIRICCVHLLAALFSLSFGSVSRQTLFYVRCALALWANIAFWLSPLSKGIGFVLFCIFFSLCCVCLLFTDKQFYFTIIGFNGLTAHLSLMVILSVAHMYKPELFTGEKQQRSLELLFRFGWAQFQVWFPVSFLITIAYWIFGYNKIDFTGLTFLKLHFFFFFLFFLVASYSLSHHAFNAVAWTIEWSLNGIPILRPHIIWTAIVGVLYVFVDWIFYYKYNEFRQLFFFFCFFQNRFRYFFLDTNDSLTFAYHSGMFLTMLAFFLVFQFATQKLFKQEPPAAQSVEMSHEEDA
jgi:hypothetical protein